MASGAAPLSEATPLLTDRRASFAQTNPGLTDRRMSISRYSTRSEVPDAALEDGLKAPKEDLTTWREETKLLSKYSWPLILTYGLQYSFNLAVVLVVGHLGTKELGAISLANMTANITGLAVYEGLATSLDTLCAQAYGSGRKELVGLHLQRMIIFLWLVTVPIAILWFSAHWFLPYLVPEKEVALLAARGLRFWILGAPGYATFEAGKRFTQAQGIFSASFWVLVICAPINAALCYTFVFQLGLGFEGAILALSITNILLPLLLFLYCVFINPSSLVCWPGFTRQALRNWIPMLKLSLPGVLMVESEWLAFDILTFASSFVSSNHLAAQSVLMTTSVLMYHIPFPVAVAASTRIGNLIGSGALRATKIALQTHFTIFLLIGLLDMVLLISLRTLLPRAFTTSPDVITIVADVMPIVAAFQLFDSTTAFFNAVLRGLGRQAIGGYTNLGVYYIFAVPTALFLAFGPAKLGLWGLWIGPACGLAVISLVEGIYVVRCSWQKAVEDAKSREE